MREQTINVNIKNKIGEHISVNVPGYVQDLKKADNRFVSRSNMIYVTLLYNGEKANTPEEKVLLLSVGKRFEKEEEQVSVAKVLCEGEYVDVYGVLL